MLCTGQLEVEVAQPGKAGTCSGCVNRGVRPPVVADNKGEKKIYKINYY